jgi:SnoaL-like domain
VWDRLAACYTDDSLVRTTWFHGTGREFADASRDMLERGRHSLHLITPTHVRVNGDRALVESLGEIHNRSSIEGVEVDTTMYCRFFSRVRRTDEGWRLVGFDGATPRT